ncbi:helix-turn-helix domain-containing protein, partial [Streptomyces sp. 1222.5]|uniref:helix-turn-helix domain-containing protein n=1 Tax=Streptomyces sp. 1222.5 TaxID=1881026 RepID=UPI003D7557D3
HASQSTARRLLTGSRSHRKDVMKKYLTTAEVADRYRTSPSTVRYWRYAGTGPQCFIRRGRRVLYDAVALDAYDAEEIEGRCAA